jgi:hypothetical protein
MNSLDEVRSGIYAAIVASGRAPRAGELAATLALDEDAVVDAFRALAAAHVIVLSPDTAEIAWAPPFSALPTPFRSTVGSMSWYAPCAWDAFGIPAALHQDAIIEARCGWTAAPLDCGVRHGRAYGDAVVHLLVPAAHFWDDIAYT